MKNKVTQSQAIFYQLYKSRLADPYKYIPIWQLIGEVFIQELGIWAFVSYEVSARMSELWGANPYLFERKTVTGKTGAHYFAYRINFEVMPEHIVEPDLKRFYLSVKQKKVCNTQTQAA